MKILKNQFSCRFSRYHVIVSQTSCGKAKITRAYVFFWKSWVALKSAIFDRNVSLRPSVCLSVTRRYCVKTKKASVMISSPSGSTMVLVF